MKLKDLLEMPDYDSREAPRIERKPDVLISETTIKDDYDVIKKFELLGRDFWVILRKDRKFADIGWLDKREDGTVGIRPEGHIDFKGKPDISAYRDIQIDSSKTLQIDGVQLSDDAVMKRGLGTEFYRSIVEYGFVIISDTMQYKGGRKLWEKLAKIPSMKVYLIDHGVPVVGEDGKPLVYNGTNFRDGGIWKENGTPNNNTHHMLLVLKKA